MHYKTNPIFGLLFNLNLLFFVLASAISSAHAVTITVDGRSYNVTTITDSFDNRSSLLRNQTWWGNQARATTFATAVGNSFGIVNSGQWGPFFAWQDTCPGNLAIAKGYDGIQSQPVGVPCGNIGFTYAIAALVPEPEPPPGPNAITTYQSLQTANDQTRTAIQQRYTVMTTVLDYDCAKFDKYGVCLSFEARGIGYGNMNTGAGVIKASYRLMDKVHAGVFLDYQTSGANPSSPSITQGTVQFGYDNATFGGFVGYNTLMGHTGFEARVTGAYNPGKVSIQRAQLIANEAGLGLAGLNAYGVYGQIGYGFPIVGNIVFTPFVGIRYTDVVRNAYAEQANILVQYPIGYNAFAQNVVTGLGGGRINGKIIENLGYELGAGIEGDYSRSFNAFSGYSYINYIGNFSLANSSQRNGMRPFTIAGLTYDVTPSQRITANTTVREQPFSNHTYMSGLVGYQLSF